MFSTLESTWDRSARRGWSTLASFGFQAMAVSLLLAIPFLWVQGPPRVRLIDSLPAPPPALPAPAPRVPGERNSAPSTNMGGTHILQPPTLPTASAILNEPEIPTAPDVGSFGVESGTGQRDPGIPGSIGGSVEVVPPPATPPPPQRPRISHWAEGNLVYRLQPVYPALARQARIQGTVELRAIVSKTGTVEQLTVVSGHPLLVKAALEAVRQWRYRPYVLNDQPIEIDTEITVNFVLSGN